jgi:hypothetical protein
MSLTMPKMLAAAFMAGLLALAAAPAQSAEPATPNDTARFLAGLPPAPDSPLAALTKDPFWQQHARYFDSIFAREDKNTLAQVRAFSAAHLTERHDAMFYMFSGPDFLFATSFFPGAKNYVLAGLEPAGEVPQLTSLSVPTVERTLRDLEISLNNILNLSFFITKNMKTQLRAGPVYGTLPVLYVFLARTGKTVHEVSFVTLNEDGTEAPGDGATASVKGGPKVALNPYAAKGVKIVFSDGSGPRQTLYYFSTNIADDGVKRSGLLEFMSKLGTADSFIKSASYLLHRGGFTKIRSFLLDHSATILQDDSGIPVAYFDPAKWRLQPIGRYLGPIVVFPGDYQPKLADLFRKVTPIPIDFGIGYRWRKNESNLLLAQRTAP